MQRLEMGTAQLVCEQRALPRASWTRSGASEVEFMFQPGAGMQARPLARTPVEQDQLKRFEAIYAERQEVWK